MIPALEAIVALGTAASAVVGVTRLVMCTPDYYFVRFFQVILYGVDNSSLLILAGFTAPAVGTMFLHPLLLVFPPLSALLARLSGLALFVWLVYGRHLLGTDPPRRPVLAVNAEVARVLADVRVQLESVYQAGYTAAKLEDRS